MTIFKAYSLSRCKQVSDVLIIFHLYATRKPNEMSLVSIIDISIIIIQIKIKMSLVIIINILIIIIQIKILNIGIVLVSKIEYTHLSGLS